MPLDFDSLLHGPIASIFGETGQGKGLPVYTPRGGTGYDVDGIFDDAYIDPEQISGLGATTTAIVFGARVAAFSAYPAQGDSLLIPRTGFTYTVVDVEPDGHGWLQLRLNQQ